MNIKMKLFKKREIENEIDFLIKTIRNNRSRLSLQAVVYDKIAVEGGQHNNPTEELIINICDMEREVSYLMEELDILDKAIKTDEELRELFGDKAPKIYRLKELNYTNKDIAAELGISERQLYRKLKEIDKIQ